MPKDVHQEYIRQTENFVYVSMEMSSAQAKKLSCYSYGPYKLKKAEKVGSKKPPLATAAKKTNGGVVQKEDKQGEKAAAKAVTGHEDKSKNKDENLQKKIYQYTNGNKETKENQSIADIKRYITGRLGAMKRSKKTTAEKNHACEALISGIIKENEGLDKTEKDILKTEIELHSKCDENFKTEFGGSKGGDTPNGDAEIVDASSDTPEITTEDSTGKPAETSVKNTATESVQVSCDFWFYTGNETDAAKIKGLALAEGVFEEDEKEKVKVLATTTTITSSSLCISSLLSTQPDVPTITEPVDQHGALSTDASGSASTHVDDQDQGNSFGAHIKEVDLSVFQEGGCLLSHIASTINTEVPSEQASTSGSQGTKDTVIFYTHAAHEGNKDPGNEKIDKLDSLDYFKFAQKNFYYRKYVPTVLCDPLVTDALENLFSRLFTSDKFPNYTQSVAIMQSMMISDIAYTEVTDAEEDKGTIPIDVALYVKKDAKPTVAVAHEFGGEDDGPQANGTENEETSYTTTGTLIDPEAGIKKVAGDLREITKLYDFFRTMPMADSIAQSIYDISNQARTLLTSELVNKHTKIADIHETVEVAVVDLANSHDNFYMFAHSIKNVDEAKPAIIAVIKKQAPKGRISFFTLNNGNEQDKQDIYQEINADIGTIRVLLRVVKEDKIINEKKKTLSNTNGVKTSQTTEYVNRDLTKASEENNTDTDDFEQLSARYCDVVRATRIVYAGNDKGRGHVAKLATFKAVMSIRELDKHYLLTELSGTYTWKSGSINDKLNSLELPDSEDEYKWHGGMSIQRILVQYAAKIGLSHSDFTTGTDNEDMTTEMILAIKEQNAIRKLRAENKALYCTWVLVRALKEQNFGALFTSQPNFQQKPFDDEQYYSKREEEGFERPDCDPDITRVVKNEETINLVHMDDEIAFVSSLEAEKVLVQRKESAPFCDLDYDYQKTKEKLDELLLSINQKDIINSYMRSSRTYESTVGQSTKCLLMFFHMIEGWLSEYYELEDGHTKAMKRPNDFITASALSYGCVSHGLDPTHLIALRYKMKFEPQGKYNKQGDRRWLKDAEWLFALSGTNPLTRELMRTRMLGAIMVIHNVDNVAKDAQAPQGAAVQKVSDADEPVKPDDPLITEVADFGRSYRAPSRRSMFI